MFVLQALQHRGNISGDHRLNENME